MNRTENLAALASELLRDPDEPAWGYALRQATGIASGVMYPILRRLVDARWLEPVMVTQPESGPVRRYYRVTPLGRQELARFVD